MDYILKETVTDIRYTANLKFTEKVGDIFRNGDFSFDFVDTVTMDSFSINSSNYAHYGITAPFTTKEEQIDNSLINNGGIVLYLNNEYEINLIVIPKCSCGDETIGFFSMNTEVSLPTVNFSSKFLIKLCPSIVRDPVPVQLDETFDDPILPLRNDRVGKDFTPEFGANYPATNIDYNTTDSMYVNTRTSGDYGYSAEPLDPNYGRVPCYINHIKVMDIPYEYELISNFRYDFDTIKSYIYDTVTHQKTDIAYEISDMKESTTPLVVISNDEKEFTNTPQYYDVTQYIYNDAPGCFKNRLVFEISQWSKEPIAKPLRLHIEFIGGLVPPEYGPSRQDPWPKDGDVYILNKDYPTWFGLVEVKNRNEAYFETKPTTTWDPEQHPYKELGPIEFDQFEQDYETLYYLSGISADRDGSVRTIDVDSYLDISDNPDYSRDLMKRYTEANKQLKVKYVKTLLNKLIITREPISTTTLTYDNNKVDIKYTIKNTDKNFYKSLDEYKTIFDTIIQVEQAYSKNLKSDAFENPIITQDDDNVYITFKDVEFSALNPGNVDTVANVSLKTWINDPDGLTHISPDWNAYEIEEQTKAIDEYGLNYKKTKLNRLNITHEFGPNGKELNYNNLTTDISFIIENTDAGFYGDEYVTTLDRIMYAQEWSRNLDTSDAEATLSGNKLILTYHNVNFSAINAGVTQDKMTTTAEGSIGAWINDPDGQDHISIEWNGEEVAEQTVAFDNLDLKYTKTPLNRLVIDKIIAEPASRELATDTSGKLIYEVVNTDKNFYTDQNEYKTILSRFQNALIEVPIGNNFLIIPTPTITPVSGDSRWQIVYDGLHFVNDYVGQASLVLSAAIKDNTKISPDWTEEEVVYWTSAITPEVNWSHNADVIDPFVITYSEYEPSAGADSIHWLAKDRQGYMPVGSAHVNIFNPNVNYRTDPSEVWLHWENDLLPRSATMENYDTSTYTADGNISFDLWGIEVDHDYSATNANLYAWGKFSATGYSDQQIREMTMVHKESEWWKYKKVIPDIYPYDEFINYSLYTLSNLEINGGRIGSKSLAARNVVCNNGAKIDSDIILASGCSISFRGANNVVNGNISAQSAYVYNSPIQLNGDLYIADELSLTDNVVANTVYTADECNVILGYNASITDPHTWENPQFADLKPIPTAEFVSTGVENVGDGTTFGESGVYTTAAYNSLDVGNNGHLTFYPGKYYFNSVGMGTDCTIDVHNDISTEDQDNSVMIFIGSVAAGGFGDRLNLNEDCTNAFAFRLYYAGLETMSFGVATQSDYGTLIAPSGTISLRNAAIWNGHIWAKNVVLQQNSEINNDNLD